MPGTRQTRVITQANPRWLCDQPVPDWLQKSLDSDTNPAVGGYSFVYARDSKYVVKLVNEPGAQWFLQAAMWTKGTERGFPYVAAYSAVDIEDAETGVPYRAFLVERLEPSGATGKYLAERYAHHYRSTNEDDSNAQRCRVTVDLFAAELRASERDFRGVNDALNLLACALTSRDLVVDLGNATNWMLRPSDGRIVLSDPVHEAGNFPDDVV